MISVRLVFAQNESPVITSFDLHTFHDEHTFQIRGWANVSDPQGQNDIAEVKIIDAMGTEFLLHHQGSGYYWGNKVYELFQFPFGDTQIIVADISGSSDTRSKSIDNVIEQLLQITYPEQGSLIPELKPTFDWNDVIDDGLQINYSINVYRQEDGDPRIWGASNLVTSEAVFNFDGSAMEDIQYGSSYLLEVQARDNAGNESYNTTRFTVGKNIKIENNYLRIDFHPYKPYMKRIVFNHSGEEMFGDIQDEMFQADIFYNDNVYNVCPDVDSTTLQGTLIRYHLKANVESNHALGFDLCYLLDGQNVKIIFENVTENEGYKLISVQSPDIITVYSNQSGGKLVFPHYEGRLIEIASANPGIERVIHGGWHRTLLTSMLYYDELTCVVTYDHLDIDLWARVSQHPLEGKFASIGIDFNYRYAPSDFTNATFIDVFDTETTSLSVSCTFLDDYDNDNDNDWIDGAKYIRDQVLTTPESKYLKSFITKVGVNGIEKPADHLVTFKKLYHLTDHNKVHAYSLDHWRWPFTIFGVEEDIRADWSFQELLHVFHEAEELYNIYFGFHDNYTDYIVGSPGYDPDLRVVQRDGLSMPGWPSPPYVSYVIDPYDYAVHEGLDRIRRIIERYPIKESHHIDVLNLVVPKDYSKHSPSSKEKNRRGIQLIIDEFDEAGIDVTVECITGPFVNSGIGWFLDVPRLTDWQLSFGNETYIPFIEFIYHGKTLYGLFEDIYYDKVPPEDVAKYTFLEPLLLGANSAAHITYLGKDDLELDKFYLIDLPWMALNEKYMEDYQEQGSIRKITYDENTYVEIDYDTDTYTVSVNGRIIGKDYTTVYQKSDSTFLIYSRDKKTVTVSLPEEWDNTIQLLELGETGIVDQVIFTTRDGCLEFNAKSNTPYKLINCNGLDTFTGEGGLTNSPVSFILYKNYPNPFNEQTHIKYSIPEATDVTISIFNVKGEKIDVLSNGDKLPGNYSIVWNAAYSPSGIYFVEMKTEKLTKINKCLLLK